MGANPIETAALGVLIIKKCIGWDVGASGMI
jgi:hypothetical protein